MARASLLGTDRAASGLAWLACSRLYNTSRGAAPDAPLPRAIAAWWPNTGHSLVGDGRSGSEYSLSDSVESDSGRRYRCALAVNSLVGCRLESVESATCQTSETEHMKATRKCAGTTTHMRVSTGNQTLQ